MIICTVVPHRRTQTRGAELSTGAGVIHRLIHKRIVVFIATMLKAIAHKAIMQGNL